VEARKAGERPVLGELRIGSRAIRDAGSPPRADAAGMTTVVKALLAVAGWFGLSLARR